MRIILVIAAAMSVTSYLPDAAAQSRAGRRVIPGRGRRATPSRRPKPQDLCPSRRAVLDTEERRLEEDTAMLAGVNAEVSQLRSRLRDLESQQKSLTARVNRERTRLRGTRGEYESQCKSNENCEQYERLTSGLESQNKPVEDALRNVGEEISRSKTEIGGLRRRIEPLRREYQTLACNNMVPGETAQTTIDRCSGIFSEWNRLQADLNRYNNRLPALRSRYQQLLAQADTIETRAKEYETYMARNCKSSRSLGTVRKYRGVRARAGNLQKELDSLVKEVTSLRGIRISVEPRR